MYFINLFVFHKYQKAAESSAPSRIDGLCSGSSFSNRIYPNVSATRKKKIQKFKISEQLNSVLE